MTETLIRPTETAAPTFEVGQMLDPRNGTPEPPVGSRVRYADGNIVLAREAGGWQRTDRSLPTLRQWAAGYEWARGGYVLEVVGDGGTEPAPEFTVGQRVNANDGPDLPVGTRIRDNSSTGSRYDRVLYADGWGRASAGRGTFIPMSEWGSRTYEIVSLPGAPAEVPTPIVPGDDPEPAVGRAMVQTRPDGTTTTWTRRDRLWRSDSNPYGPSRSSTASYRWDGGWAHLDSTFVLLPEGVTEAPAEAPSEPVEAPRMVDGEKVVEVAMRLAQDNLGTDGRKVVQDKLIELGLLELKPVPVAGKQIEASTIIEITRQLKSEESWCGVADKALKEMGAVEPTKIEVGVFLEDRSDIERVPLGSVVRNNCCRGRLVRIGAGSENTWRDLAGSETFDMGVLCGGVTIEFVPAD